MRYLVPLFMAVILLVAFQAHADEKVCTAQYAPVCGAKPVQCVAAPCYPVYQTYGNSCVMGSEGGEFIHEGECTTEEAGPVIPKKTDVLEITPANTDAAVQVGQELATITLSQDPGFWDRVWSRIVRWFSLV